MTYLQILQIILFTHFYLQIFKNNLCIKKLTESLANNKI